MTGTGFTQPRPPEPCEVTSYLPQSLFNRVVLRASNVRHSPHPEVFEIGSYACPYQPAVSPDSGLIDQ